MKRLTAIRMGCLLGVMLICTGNSYATQAILDTSDPLVSIDLNRNAIIADIVRGFEATAVNDGAGAAKLKARLEKLRADRLLAASLASSRESLDAIIAEGETSRSARTARVSEKALGDANRDLVYTPISPCRLVDTRGFGAPFQGGPLSPFERRSYIPNGLCSLPTSNVASLMLSVTTQNLTPSSGGYLTILSPGSPVSVANDVFNLGAEWSSLATTVSTGSAGQFDVFVNQATAHVVVDIVGYFGPPTGGTAGGGGTVTSISTGTGLAGGPISSSGTISIANAGVGTVHLADSVVTTAKVADGAVTSAKLASNGCTTGQTLQFNGAAWVCASPGTQGPTGRQGNSIALVGPASKDICPEGGQLFVIVNEKGPVPGTQANVCNGLHGLDGARGAVGPKGDKGDKGDMGPAATQTLPRAFEAVGGPRTIEDCYQGAPESFCKAIMARVTLGAGQFVVNAAVQVFNESSDFCLGCINSRKLRCWLDGGEAYPPYPDEIVMDVPGQTYSTSAWTTVRSGPAVLRMFCMNDMRELGFGAMSPLKLRLRGARITAIQAESVTREWW